MTYLIILFIIIMAVLLGLGRSLLADILHLVSAVAAFVLTLLLTHRAAEAVTALLQGTFLKSQTLPEMTVRLISALISPLTFSLLFVVSFTVIGLITHIIGRLIRTEKKPRFLPKLILNLLAGLLIAYGLLVPLGYYPQNQKNINEMVLALDSTVDISGLPLQKYQLPELIYRPVLNSHGKVRMDYASASLDEIMDIFRDLRSLDYAGDPLALVRLAQQLQADQRKDALYGDCVQMIASQIGDPLLARIMAHDGTMTAKLDAVNIVSQFSTILSRHAADNLSLLKEMMKDARTDSYAIAADIFDEETLGQYHPYLANNAPLIAQLIWETAALEERGDVVIDKEAQALVRLLSRSGPRDLPLNYIEMTAEEAAGYLNASTVFQKAVIQITDAGALKDPCRMNGTVYNRNAREILQVLTSRYGLAKDSELYMSLLAYFDISDN